MDINTFAQVINRFDNGQVTFNLGSNWSFLFNQKWYPTHAFMVEYNYVAGNTDNVTLHSAVNTLSKFIPVASSEVTYQTHFPEPVLNSIIYK